MRLTSFRALALGLLASSSACFSLDPSLTKPDPEDASADVDVGEDGEVAPPDQDADVQPPGEDAYVAPPEEDAGALPEAGPNGDGGSLDASQPTPDAQVDAAVLSCKQDSECAAEQFCSSTSRCVARCDAKRGCAGPRIDNFESMTSIDDEPLWATRNTSDSLGNPRADAALWRWDRKGAPTQVARNLSVTGSLAFVIDGHAYFHKQSTDGTQPLRIALGATSGPGGTWSDATVWFSQNYVWWAPRLSSLSGTAGLHRMARQADATHELVRELALVKPGFLTGTESHVFVTDGPNGQIHREAIDGSSRLQIAAPGSATQLYGCRVQGSNLLCLDSLLSLIAFDTTAFGQYRALGRFVNPPDPTGFSYVGHYQLLGDWVYWSAANGGSSGRANQFGRSRVDLAREPEVLKTMKSDKGPQLSSFPFVVSSDGRQLTYFDVYETRLFTLDVAALPCANDLPCASGLTCQSDQTCR